MLHLSDRHCLVLLPFLHGSWLCPLFRRWLSSVLTAHVLCRQLVGLLHKSHLLVHRGKPCPSRFPVPTPAMRCAPTIRPSPHCRFSAGRRSFRAWRSGHGRRLRRTGWSAAWLALPFLPCRPDWRGRSPPPFSVPAISRSNMSPSCPMARLRLS